MPVVLCQNQRQGVAENTRRVKNEVVFCLCGNEVALH